MEYWESTMEGMGIKGVEVFLRYAMEMKGRSMAYEEDKYCDSLF